MTHGGCGILLIISSGNNKYHLQGNIQIVYQISIPVHGSERFIFLQYYSNEDIFHQGNFNIFLHFLVQLVLDFSPEPPKNSECDQKNNTSYGNFQDSYYYREVDDDHKNYECQQQNQKLFHMVDLNCSKKRKSFS